MYIRVRSTIMAKKVINFCLMSKRLLKLHEGGSLRINRGRQEVEEV